MALIEQYEATPNSDILLAIADYTQIAVQCFRAPVSGTLSSVVFQVKKSGVVTNTVISRFYNSITGTLGSTAEPDYSAVASSDSVDGSTITDTYQSIVFTYTGANKVSITKGNLYAIGVQALGATAPNRYVLGGVTSGTHNGNSATYSFQTSLWSWSSIDIPFKLYIDDIKGPFVTAFSLGL